MNGEACRAAAEPMPDDPYGARIPVWLVRGLLHDQLNALTVLTSRLRAIRDGIHNTRITADEVLQSEDTVQWLERMTREALRNLAHPDPGRPGDRCEVRRIVDAAIRRWSAGMPPVDVETDVEEGEWIALPPTALERILQNLLMNAAEHARGRVLVCMESDGDSVVVSVEDDGPGFPAEEFPPIGASQRRGGHGLGLSVVRWLAEHWGGSAHVGRSPGLEGARVSVRAPRSEPPPPTPEAPRLDRLLEGVRVALVEDVPEVLRAMGAYLERTGADVVRVSAERDATVSDLVRRVQADGAPDVVLVDLNLGPVSGFDVLDALLDEGCDPGSLILMSGTDPEDGAPEGVERIAKPPDWPMLIRMIRERAAS